MKEKMKKKEKKTGIYGGGGERERFTVLENIT